MTFRTKMNTIGLVPMLIIVAICLTTFSVTRSQRNDGLVINLAGRQRMLTQKMTKELFMVEAARKRGEDPAKFIAQTAMTMRVFETTLGALKDGGPAPLQVVINGETTYRECPPASGEAYAQLQTVEATWARLKPLYEKALAEPEQLEALNVIKTDNITLLKEMNTGVELMQGQTEAKTRWLYLVQLAGVLGGGLTLGVFWLLIRIETRGIGRVVHDLLASSSDLASSSSNFADMSFQLAQNATEQAACIEQTSASLRMMEEGARGNKDQTDAMANHAVKGRQATGHALEIAERSTQGIRQLSASTEAISEIINGVQDIAFKTNLLALNAAVEAARAGDHGRGFAVVAEEVRALAGQAAAAVTRSEDLIRGNINGFKEISGIIHESQQSIQAVADRDVELDSSIDSIQRVTSEQFESLHQITQSLGQIDVATQSMAGSAENLTDSSRKIEEGSRVLDGVIHSLSRRFGV